MSPVPETTIPVGSRQHLKKSEGNKCRILLDEIHVRQLTFVVLDQRALTSLYGELSSLRDEMRKYKSWEDGLVLEGGESNPYTRKSEKKGQQGTQLY